jgi:serine/threonine protein kinase
MTTQAVQGSGGGPASPDGARVGPYRLLQPLGEGGMGVVHLALDPNGRAVALKILRPHVAHDPGARTRLRREVDVLGRIRDPRIAAVVDADLDGDRPYLVTRYVPGPPLDEVVREHGPMRGDQLLRLGRGLAEALDVIHEADVIHRDLKPGNVLMLDDDPVLIDFGIAHVADDVRITMTGLVMGTPGYLSPEVVEGATVTEATDWWGWAATLAFAASGASPFGRGPMDAVLSRVSRGEADLSGVDPRLAPLLYAALSPEPRQRPDADEVLDALERYAHGRPVTEALTAPTRHTQVLEQASTHQLDRPPVAFREPEPELVPWDEPDEEVSDWQAAWETGAGEPDPRIGREMRTGTLLVVLLAVVAAAASFPVATAAFGVVWSWAARTADRSVTSLVLRRHSKGRRRSDVPFAVAASPWHLVVGALATVISAVLPLVVGTCAVFSAALATTAVSGGSPHPNAAVPLAVGALLAVLTAWWGPGGSGLRRGSRSIVRGVVPGTTATRVAVAVGLVLAGGFAVWTLKHGGQPQWWPWQAPGSVLPSGLGLG